MITLLPMFKFARQRKVENAPWNHLEMQASCICNCMDVTSNKTILKYKQQKNEIKYKMQHFLNLLAVNDDHVITALLSCN